MTKKPILKYVLTFIITAAIFTTAFILSNYFNSKKTQDLQLTENQIAIELLSSETQFDILKESSCSQSDENILADELNSLGSQLNYMENQLGSDNPDVLQLKKYYSILQIKDYLLMKQYSTQCKTKPVSILYFYANNCTDCQKQGYVLTYLRDEYPGLRVYSFDYNLDLSAVRTLISINKVPTSLPALIINDKTYNGFMSTDQVDAIIKPLFPVATSTATTTKATSTKTTAR